jgi:hypothetical protein
VAPNHMAPDDSDGSSAMDYWGNDGDITQNHGRYQLAYMDLYDPVRHGFDNQVSDEAIHGQFLCNMSINVEQWRHNPARTSSGEESLESELDITVMLNENGGAIENQPPGETDGLYIPATDQFIPYMERARHPLVRCAYDRAFIRKICGELQVVELDYLSGGETICIPKTYALRLFQRRWRNRLNARREARRRYGHPRALINREVRGRF